MVKRINKRRKILKSLFGNLKGKIRPFTTKERDTMWRDDYRKI